MTVWFFTGDSFDWIEAHTRVTGVTRVTVELFLAAKHNVRAGGAGRMLPCILDGRTDCGLAEVDSSKTVDYFTASRKRTGSADDGATLAPPRAGADPARSPRPGDVVLFTGVVWTPFYAEVFRRLAARGIGYCVLLHDIIPIERPDLVSANDAATFGGWLQLVVDTAAIVFVSSQATKDMLLRWAALEGLAIRPRVVVVTFGSTDLAAAVGAKDRFAPFGRGAIDCNGFVLSVGTLDKRKNQVLLCRIWRRLVAELGPTRVPQLVLAGRNDLPEDQLGMSGLGDKVVNLQGLSDGEISDLYHGCLFTVFPSLCEGYGLPVAESLAHGKLCVTSDLPVIREHSGDLVWYFDPDSEDACYEKLRSAITRDDLRAAAERKIAEEYDPPSWRATSGMIVREIEALARPSRDEADPQTRNEEGGSGRATAPSGTGRL
jgi:glycosyltransferase involved in cell wall biosynthesis